MSSTTLGPAAQISDGVTILWVVWGAVGLITLAFLLGTIRIFPLWLQAYMSNAHVELADLIGMKLRKVDLSTIVPARITLVKAGLHDITVEDLEAHYLSGGRVMDVAREIIAAKPSDVRGVWKEICANDFAEVGAGAATRLGAGAATQVVGRVRAVAGSNTPRPAQGASESAESCRCPTCGSVISMEMAQALRGDPRDD